MQHKMDITVRNEHWLHEIKAYVQYLQHAEYFCSSRQLISQSNVEVDRTDH